MRFFTSLKNIIKFPILGGWCSYSKLFILTSGVGAHVSDLILPSGSYSKLYSTTILETFHFILLKVNTLKKRSLFYLLKYKYFKFYFYLYSFYKIVFLSNKIRFIFFCQNDKKKKKMIDIDR